MTESSKFLKQHLEIREVRTWGTYGKEGDQPLKRLKISELSNDHLRAILRTQHHLSIEWVLFLTFELGYRAGAGIEVPDE